MTTACDDVSALSAGFSFGPSDEVPLESLYRWHDDITSAAGRIERLIAEREAQAEEARWAATEQEAAA